MKRYASQSPRAAFGVAAVAMTTLTIALLVALPAQVGTGSQDLSAVIAAAYDASTPRPPTSATPLPTQQTGSGARP